LVGVKVRPFTLLIKPAGPDCNIACRYCFYSGKTALFGKGKHRMSDEVLDKLISSYMRLKFPSSSFAWQGGEPMLMGLDFYKKVVELQQRCGTDGQVVTNALQTNGILLDEQWCKFLSEYKFLVGISLDGPKEYHDYYRRTPSGRGTFDKVMAGIESCRKNKVEFNILVLVSAGNVGAPDKIFDFFKELKIKYLQFVQCVENDPATGRITEFAITPKQYGDFLCRIFDRWIEFGPDQISIRTFDSILSYLMAGEHSICTFRPQCNDYIVIEHNGEAFCCDFFVEDRWRLGNILETSIEKLAADKKKRKFARLKTTISNKCLICRHLDICRGGCLKDRIVINGDYKAASYFCDSYKNFFDYALPRFYQIAAKLRQSAHPPEAS
jgi:uncharacterized protein